MPPSSRDNVSIDALLNQLAFNSKLLFESGLCGAWRLYHQDDARPSVHLVTQGTCWLTFPDQLSQPQQLNAGDAVLFTRTIKHWISSQPVTTDTLQTRDPAVLQEPHHASNGLVCYDINIESDVTQAVFNAMPDWLHVPARQQSSQLSQLIGLITSEAKSQQAGYEIAISRLSDVLMLQLMRQLLENDRGQQGILAGMRDEKMRGVILAIFADPATNWQVEKLAELSYLSRSAFADKCQQITGFSPKQLVGEIRMQHARQCLLQSELSLEQIAEQIGYQSATAFIRFFKQHSGVAPGAFRDRR